MIPERLNIYLVGILAFTKNDHGPVVLCLLDELGVSPIKISFELNTLLAKVPLGRTVNINHTAHLLGTGEVTNTLLVGLKNISTPFARRCGVVDGCRAGVDAVVLES
jgi:hypothetical protein